MGIQWDIAYLGYAAGVIRCYQCGNNPYDLDTSPTNRSKWTCTPKWHLGSGLQTQYKWQSKYDRSITSKENVLRFYMLHALWLHIPFDNWDTKKALKWLKQFLKTEDLLRKILPEDPTTETRCKQQPCGYQPSTAIELRDAHGSPNCHRRGFAGDAIKRYHPVPI